VGYIITILLFLPLALCDLKVSKVDFLLWWCLYYILTTSPCACFVVILFYLLTPFSIF
jgi:hypothetical protein